MEVEREEESMAKRTTFLVVAVAALAGAAIFTLITSRRVAAQETAPIFVKEVPPGYRDLKCVSVAHEAGGLNDIRAVLGNDIATKAYRDGRLPFPEGAIVGRTTRPLAESNLSSPARRRTPTCSSWSRIPRSTRRQAD